jgi:hypothetical protein
MSIERLTGLLTFCKTPFKEVIMAIEARFATPGRRYLTQKGKIIEAAAHRGQLDSGEVALWRDVYGGDVFFYTVDGDTRTNIYLRVPEAYKITEVINPGVEYKKGKRGRRRHVPSDWRGWAYCNPKFGEQLCKMAEDSGFFVEPVANYLKICWRTKVVSIITRSGEVGFPIEPDMFKKYEFGAAQRVEGDPDNSFMPYRISLKLIVLANHFDQFKVSLKSYLMDTITIPRKRRSRRAPK